MHNIGHTLLYYQKHVIWLDISVNEAHGVNGIKGQDQLGRVETGPLFRNIVVGHQVYQITT
jgi:hypothetical protein